MAITASSSNAQGQAQRFSASHLDDAGAPAAASHSPGFRPSYVKVENVTDRISWEWYEGMSASHCVQTVAAGTKTLITSAGVTVTVAEGSQPNIAYPVIQNKQYRVLAIA